MTKLSQCARCKKDRRNCGYYKDEDDTDCPYCVCGDGNQENDESTTGVKTIVQWAFFYTLVSIYVCIKWFDDAKVLYIWAIPLVILIVWAVIAYLKNKRKTKQGMKKVSMTDGETARVYKELPDSLIRTNNSKDMDSDMEQMDIQLPDTTTRTSLMVALRKLNLQYEFDDDQQFMVTYQGECFRLIAENGHAWLHIQDCWWYRESLDDIDNVALLHRAVNECNIRDVNKIVYTYNKVEREIGLHVLREILWLPQIPDSEQYLQTTFDTMLRSHQIFFRMMESLRKEEFARNN